MGETNKFSPIFLEYLNNAEKLRPFFSRCPELENFGAQIEEKQFSAEKRQILRDSLLAQYEGIEISAELQNNIGSLLDPNTYTVTTGHQLNIFTGPLYFILKIITAIKVCEDLKQRYPERNFVPVYWAATEDHDFEEINHFNLFGTKYTWNTDQKGPVGRFDTASIQGLIDSLPEKPELFVKAYSESKTLASAVRKYINGLFGASGLVMIDGDRPELKALFSHVVKSDLQEHKANDSVNEYSQKLESLGYKAQVFPRKINFFYMEDGLRERIIPEEDGTYSVLNTELKFEKEELLDLVDSHPERFSPNVALRPLYEETILPNLTYIGGPGELAYWLQLKGVFETYGERFPILFPRAFAMVISKANLKKMEKAEISVAELFLPENELKELLTKRHGDADYEISTELAELAQVFEKIKAKAGEVDKSLTGFVGAEQAKALKSAKNIEKRLRKAEEQKAERAIAQAKAVTDKLFPNGGLQERHDNFLNFQLNNPDFIGQLTQAINAFDFRFNILTEEQTKKEAKATVC
ncbi:putative cysteine ligase BshC [Fulvitalea axinellae]|uniref:Putative cysteine ligase BshC n=2 Tax=Fulvitalea axinellae TaxID=1182444 RepID=A0AAU9CLB9_9BACT|nr:putative cysteine ligase BshC [Fulvitalea axinellae]